LTAADLNDAVLSAPRRGGKWRRVASQAIGSGALGTISWDTEDEDTNGYLTPTSTTVTIPAGLGGIYVISFEITASGAMSAGGTLWLNTGANTSAFITAAGTGGVITWSGPLAAAATLTASFYNGHSGSLNFTGSFTVYRVSG
jgi:hypothetical protein